jgi:serine/threonine protein kinase
MFAAVGSSDDSSESSGGSAFAPTATPPGVFVPPEPESLAPHFPQLEILESLGHGGMGAVYKARQTKLDRFVALKIIRPEVAEDAAFAERFNREARTLARLNHPNIVAVHDFGEVSLSDPEDENAPSRTLYYFLMEYVDGANLRQMILSGELEADQTLAIIPQICEGLQFAHDAGVVHRDIKPENVLVDRRGRVKIADFGLAKLTAQSPEDFTLTGTHQVMGTPRYMAPEQMAGSHAVDHRADIYSLGVVFYEMLTGALPMGRFEPPSKKAGVDSRLDDIVHLALASDPDQRYQRASEIRADIESIVMEQYSAISQAGGEQNSSLPNPGLSTILEQQVAGVVNRFRRRPDDDSSVPPSQRLPADRAAAQRQVGGPGRKSVSARMSGKAIVGACLAPIVFVPLLVLLQLRFGDAVIQVAGLAVVGLPALLALIGTTVLGLIALGDIRHSNGKLTGLGLAFFDAALFPIFLLDALILGLVFVANPGGGTMTFAPAAVLCAVIDTLILRSAWRKVSFGSLNADPHQRDIGTPLANVRFAIPDGEEIGPRVIFHFSGLGYQLIDEQPDVWVFERGQPMGGLWSMNIRDLHTKLTVRTMAGNADELLVSCDWSVRTLGAWASGGDIKKLKAEGQQLRPLLGGDDYGKKSVSNSTKRRFSRKAIVAACWAAFFLLVVPLVIVSIVFIDSDGSEQNRRMEARLELERISYESQKSMEYAEQDGPEGQPIGTQQGDSEPVAQAEASAGPGSVGGTKTWIMLFSVFVGLPLAAAPFATTILGCMAISDVRNSRGRMSGLGLAFFDAVCFPVLITNTIAIGLIVWIGVNNELNMNGIIMILLFTLLVLFLGDFVVLRKLWRGVVMPIDDGSSNGVSSSMSQTADPTQTSV